MITNGNAIAGQVLTGDRVVIEDSTNGGRVTLTVDTRRYFTTVDGDPMVTVSGREDDGSLRIIAADPRDRVIMLCDTCGDAVGSPGCEATH